MNTKKTTAKSTNKKPEILLKETADEQLKELEDKLKKMCEDQEKKCKAAKKQLIEQLNVTALKYRTATGTAEALRVLRFTMGDNPLASNNEIIMKANELAMSMAKTVEEMAKKAEGLDAEKMDRLCDGYYDKGFVLFEEAEKNSHVILAFEMMRIDLCRNVGEAAEDMTSFWERSQEEIASTREAIADLKKSMKD